MDYQFLRLLLLHLWINERRATPFEKKIQKFLHEFFNPNSSLAIGKSKGRDPTKFLTYFSASLFVGLLSSGCCNWPTSPASPHHKRWLVFWPIFVQKLEKYRAVRFVSLCWHQNYRLEYCKKRFLKTPHPGRRKKMLPRLREDQSFFALLAL